MVVIDKHCACFSKIFFYGPSPYNLMNFIQQFHRILYEILL